MSIRILPFRLISRDSREIPGVEGKTCIRLCCNQKWRRKLRVHFCSKNAHKETMAKSRPGLVALDLISTHDCQYMSEMKPGRLSGRTFWGRENGPWSDSKDGGDLLVGRVFVG